LPPDPPDQLPPLGGGPPLVTTIVPCLSWGFVVVLPLEALVGTITLSPSFKPLVISIKLSSLTPVVTTTAI
jgi:hypothetical protein